MAVVAQNEPLSFEAIVSQSGRSKAQRLETFAVLNLGILESLASGAVAADEATERFYNAANCLFVRRRLKDSVCDDVMSRGVQLADVVEILPAGKAQREFAREIGEMRRLCLSIMARTARRANGRSR